MTDKEYKEAARKKSDELIEKMYPYFINWEDTQEMQMENAVECAKIAIQEILDLDVMWHGKEIQKDYPGLYSPEQTREFWVEVMEELNK